MIIVPESILKLAKGSPVDSFRNHPLNSKTKGNTVSIMMNFTVVLVYVFSDAHFRCANGFHITMDKVCNRWIDCDESHLDESECKLTEGYSFFFLSNVFFFSHFIIHQLYYKVIQAAKINCYIFSPFVQNQHLQ